MSNMALAVVPLCLLGIYFAERKQDFTAGVILSAATALKPQIGLWVLLFYLIQFRKRFMIGALLPAVGLLAALISYPIPAGTLISGYRSNLQYWFEPGRMIGFTDGAMPFHVNTSQVILYQLLHRVTLTSALANGMFACGLVIWSYAVWQARFRISVPLAISSLLALSFISLYHSVSDATILTLALCWAYGEGAGAHELEQTGNLRSVPVDDAAGTLGSDPISAPLERRGNGLLVVEAAGGAIFHLAAARPQCGFAIRAGYRGPRIKNAGPELSKRRRGARGRIVFPYPKSWRRSF